MAKLVVVGSAHTDMVVETPSFPVSGQGVTGYNFIMTGGGKGANQAMAAVRMGLNVTFLTRLGNDAFGKTAREGFAKERINIKYVIMDREAPSGVALVMVAPDGTNGVVVAPGAGNNLAAEDINAASEEFELADLVLLQMQSPMGAIRRAVELSKHLNKKVILNLSPATNIDDDILPNINYLTINLKDLIATTGIEPDSHHSMYEACKFYHDKGVPTVIVFLGQAGAFVSEPGNSYYTSSFEVRVKDTTGAADVFNGALAAGLAVNRDLGQSVRFAVAAAALSMTQLGAQPSIPWKQQVDQFIEGSIQSL